MLCTIDRFALSTDGAAPSTDLLFAQASIDRAAMDRAALSTDDRTLQTNLKLSRLSVKNWKKCASCQ